MDSEEEIVDTEDELVDSEEEGIPTEYLGADPEESAQSDSDTSEEEDGEEVPVTGVFVVGEKENRAEQPSDEENENNREKEKEKEKNREKEKEKEKNREKEKEKEKNREKQKEKEKNGEEMAKQKQKDPKKQKMSEKEKAREKEKEKVYEVGDFVTAIYDGDWFIAQVDIDQDKAGDTHVNLSYMEKIAYNQFRWPKNHDLLLTLKEDILTSVSDLKIVGSSIRANHVGLKDNEAQEADIALAMVLYLHSFHFFIFFSIFLGYHSVLVVGTGTGIVPTVLYPSGVSGRYCTLGT